jgi:hypothetical protein
MTTSPREPHDVPSGTAGSPDDLLAGAEGPATDDDLLTGMSGISGSTGGRAEPMRSDDDLLAGAAGRMTDDDVLTGSAAGVVEPVDEDLLAGAAGRVTDDDLLGGGVPD